MCGMSPDFSRNMNSGGFFGFFDPDTLRCSGQALLQKSNKVKRCDKCLRFMQKTSTKHKSNG